MKFSKSNIVKIIREELESVLKENERLTPEDTGTLRAVSQALDKAIDVVMQHTNIDNDNESTHKGVEIVNSLLNDSYSLIQQILSGKDVDFGNYMSQSDKNKTVMNDTDLMLISTALANPSDKSAIEAAQEIVRNELKTSLYEEQSATPTKNINEVKEEIAQALAKITSYINELADDRKRNDLTSAVIAVSEEIRSLEKSLGARGKEIGYVVPRRGRTTTIKTDPRRRVTSIAEDKNDE